MVGWILLGTDLFGFFLTFFFLWLQPTKKRTPGVGLKQNEQMVTAPCVVLSHILVACEFIKVGRICNLTKHPHSFVVAKVDKVVRVVLVPSLIHLEADYWVVVGFLASLIRLKQAMSIR